MIVLLLRVWMEVEQVCCAQKNVVMITILGVVRGHHGL